MFSNSTSICERWTRGEERVALLHMHCNKRLLRQQKPSCASISSKASASLLAASFSLAAARLFGILRRFVHREAALDPLADVERVCCLVVLDSVTSTPQWIRQPKPRDGFGPSVASGPSIWCMLAVEVGGIVYKAARGSKLSFVSARTNKRHHQHVKGLLLHAGSTRVVV